METIELSRLNALSFERLVRALCFNTFGPSGTVFSSGPDGGRDFSFEGAIPGYGARSWDGYLIVQATFREKLSDGSDDIDWLIQQLREELVRFADKRTGRKPPEFYILATNVSLSGADGRSRNNKMRRGGHSKISDELASWAPQIGLKDFDIWAADKIIDLLVDAPKIRQTYAAWITSGDVLAAALGTLSSQRKLFTTTVPRALKISLRRDQYARLKDAGSVADLQIRTSQVFVDLPASIEDGGDDTSNSFGVVGALVERARDKFDHESYSSERDARSSTNYTGAGNKIVVIGGPGQGKSTASLFLTQIFRSAILATDPSTLSDGNIKFLAPEILKRAQAENINSSAPLRYPVHVVLPRFADTISSAKSEYRDEPSLLAYIADDISRASDTIVERDDIREWLSKYPWLVVLDGLDEVPPSGERGAVLEAIADFLTEVSDATADVMVVVTTRPQGYNSDLSPQVWEHWQLVDLPIDRALAYANALALAQYPDDPERRRELSSRMTDAASKPATSRLMISPLQTTIMHMIVDTGGSIPAARWTLFDEYFEILKKREKAKGGATQRILERNLAYLGPIHQRVGLILQTQSERAGGAGATLTHERFRRLLAFYLLSEGFTSEVLEERVSELMEVALHRLVLLSTRDEGRISFDVRSLQEYMAAAAITAGDLPAMEARLLHIAGKAHWQHVFLIAASRCFSDDSYHHRRSSVLSVPRQLETNENDMLVRNGARLALEMFVDGIGIDHPVFRRQLATHALDLLDLGDDFFSDNQLTLLWEPETAKLISSSLRDRIRSGTSKQAIGAWSLLFGVIAQDATSACALIEELWPSNGSDILQAASDIPLPIPSAYIARLLYKEITKHPPGQALVASESLFEKLAKQPADERTPADLMLSPLNLKEKVERLKLHIMSSSSQSAFDGYCTSINGSIEDVDFSQDRLTDAWASADSINRFYRDPSRITLASALKQIATDFADASRLMEYTPWPIASIIGVSNSQADLMVFADAAERGAFGDSEDWLRAEHRWQTKGITLGDLAVATSGAPFGREVAELGFPLFRISSIKHGSVSIEDLFRAAEIADQTSNKKLRQELWDWIQFGLFGIDSEKQRSTEENLKIIEIIEKTNSVYVSLSVFRNQHEILKSDVLVDRVSELYAKTLIIDQMDVGFTLDDLISKFNDRPARRNLIYPITFLMANLDGFGRFLKRLHSSARSERPDDPPHIKGCIALLDVFAGDWNKDDLDSIIEKVLGDNATSRALLIVAAMEPSQLSQVEVLVAEFVKRNVASVNLSPATLRHILKRILDARRTQLFDVDVWTNKFHLPADAHNALQSATS